MVKLDFCRYSSKYPEYRAGGTPNIFNPRMAAGGLMDMGIYLVYPAIYWFGVPSKIAADASILRTGADACGTVPQRGQCAYHNVLWQGQHFAP